MAATAVALIGLAVTIGTTAYAYASAPGTPQGPNLNAASRAGVLADASTLADRRRLEAAAQQGTSTTYMTGPRTVKREVQFVKIPTGATSGKIGAPTMKDVPYVASEWQEGGKYFKSGEGIPVVFTKHVKVHIPAQERTADFTGYGEADVQGKLAEENATNQLALEKKYGPQFIEEALKQQELADPNGTAARNKIYELIQQQAGEQPDRPVANLLDSQVADQLAAGKGLDHISNDVLDEAVAQAQASRGEGSSQTDYADPLTSGFAGQSRLSAAQQKALGWLSSGATPEDVRYRREQQTMANEGAFINGQTPESQFQNLSGAQNGATPIYNGRPLPGQSPGAGAAAQGAAVQGFNAQLGAQASQADHWLSGLSVLLHGASAAGQAGYRPLAQTVSTHG